MSTEAKQKAQQGLLLIKRAVAETVARHPGITNAEIAHALGLESEYRGGSKNYLSHSVLGLLLKERKIRRKSEDGGVHYFMDKPEDE